MQSADIRLVPSRTLSIGFDDKQSTYSQDTSSILTSGYDDSVNSLLNTTNGMDNLDINSFHDLSISQSEMELLASSTSHEEHDHYDIEEDTIEREDEDETEDETEEEETQLPSATADAMETYVNITENIYCGSATGKSIAEESMPCECKYRPDVDNPGAACGDDNYCINRMMFMECMVDDCPCERYCRNRRFQLRQYARVDVIRTDKKGFGLRALTDLPTNAFIMEYIGEVIPNHEFIRRTKEYEAAGLEHYYFMTLKTDEIIDATKKGCLARFINHSCNPNSVTQKWVVGKNMRIGIFTRRPIKAGQELTFDYKFERYGAVAQPCYCGEPTCKGFIGGSMKSDTVKTSTAVISTTVNDHIVDEDEDDDDDDESEEDQIEEDSDTAEAVTLTQKKMLRKMYRRKDSEPLKDREVQSFVKRMLDSVGKSHLVLKLLHRLELIDKDTAQGRDVLRKFVRLHGLKMLKFWLGEWKNDTEILIKVLHVLSQLPLANKNGLEDCKMFEIVGKLSNHEDQDICTVADQLLQDWDKLKSVYRIPKRIPAESRKKEQHSDNDDELSEVSADIVIPPRFDSSREFFDPDDDYFEYLSMESDATEIQWKTEYPPKSAIPTAPRAMIDACIKNGYYGFGGRPSRISTNLYPENNGSVRTNSEETDSYDRPHSTFSSPYTKSCDYKNSKLNSSSAFDSPTGSPSTTTTIPTAPAAASAPKLPNNWKSAYAEDGTIYYYHRISGKTQWSFPEERVSSIEGVNQSDLEDLVEKAIQESEKKKKEIARSESPAVSITSRNGAIKASPRVITPSISRRGSVEAGSMDETELKKEVGKIVTKYLSAKKKDLWKGDKYLFKELARKITHHIVDRETQSSRKIHAMNSSVRTKIEKFIDSHGLELVLKVNRKRKHQAITSTSKEKTESPSSVASENFSKRSGSTFLQPPYVDPEVYIEQQSMPLPLPLQEVENAEENVANGNGWSRTDEIPTSPASKRRALSLDDTHHDDQRSEYHRSGTTASTSAAPIDKPSHHSTKDDSDYYYSRRSQERSPYSNRDKLYSESTRGEYVRPGYSRPPHYSSYSSSSYYRYPPPSSGSYYKNSSRRYYSSRSPSSYYHRGSSRRNSLSDDDMDRRRWD